MAGCRRLELIDVTPHSLRASCASWVAESDGVLEAARRLGHARTSVTTRHYARPMVGGDRIVADRLEASRQAVQQGAQQTEPATDVARMWHDEARVTPPEQLPDVGHTS